MFSSSVGFKKPDHGIYKLTIKKLGVESTDCLFVGNGLSSELCGAHELGMYPVLITPGNDEGFLYMIPEDEEIALARREGSVISSLKELLSLIG